MFRLLLAVVLVAVVNAADFKFVKPVFIDPDKPFNPRNIEKLEVDGVRVFKFEAQDVTETEEIEQLLKQSKMVNFVIALRDRGRELHRDIHGELATADEPDAPMYLYYGSDMGHGGPAMASGFRLSSEGNRTDSLMLLAPLKFRGGVMELSHFVKQKYFAPLIAHEMFHGIMGDVYGKKMYEMKARSYSRNGHAADRVTDEFISFIEGTAEAMEIAVLEMFPKEVNHKLVEDSELTQKVKDFIGTFKKNRLVTAFHNKFVFEANGKKLDGVLGNPRELLKTEGVVASLFYKVLFKSGLENPFEKALNTMVQLKPLTFMDFMKGICELYPEDAKSLQRMFLESTYYVTVSPEAHERYKAYYLTRKAYKQGKVEKSAVKAVIEEWTNFKKGLYAQVRKGELSLDQYVPSRYIVADEYFFYEIDLNSSPADEMADFFDEYISEVADETACKKYIADLIKGREFGNFVVDMDSIVFADDVEAMLEKFHNIYLEESETKIEQKVMRLQEGMYSGFVEEGEDPIKHLLGGCHH